MFVTHYQTELQWARFFLSIEGRLSPAERKYPSPAEKKINNCNPIRVHKPNDASTEARTQSWPTQKTHVRIKYKYVS